MAIIKNFTDISQSKKLAEFLPIESADNVIVSIGDREGVKTITMPKETFNILRTPFTDIRETTMCWSLTALFSVLPDDCGIDKEDGKYVASYLVSNECGTYTSDNPIDACVQMIIRLKELNLLNYEE